MSIPYKEIAEALWSGISIANQVRKTMGNDAAAKEIERLAGLLRGGNPGIGEVGQLDPADIRAELDRMVDRITGNDRLADDIVDQRFPEKDQDAADTARGKKVRE